MRNTPYPAHTLGSFGHKTVALAKTKGIIQGILKMDDDHLIHSQDIKDFEYLPEGEKKTFEDTAWIEIVIFDSSDVSRAGPSSYIFKRRIELEKGATLTGPMSWRTASVAGITGRRPSGQIALGMVSFVIAFLGVIFSFFSSTFAVAFVGVEAIGLVLWLVIDALDKMKVRAIERLGSVYVLAQKV